MNAFIDLQAWRLIFLPLIQRKKIMLKNIIFVLLSLFALAISPAVLAVDDPATEAVLAEPVAATIEPAAPPAPAPKARQEVSNTRPVNDNHTDFRYCLELKTNIEIAQCRYKKK